MKSVALWPPTARKRRHASLANFGLPHFGDRAVGITMIWWQSSRLIVKLS